MSHLDVLLHRLDARPNGNQRWRAACPSCGGRNKSSLSVALADSGSVLLKCFKEQCAVETITAAVGMAISDLFPETPREAAGGTAMKRPLLTANQALDLLEVESMTVGVIAADMAKGGTISEADFQRLKKAVTRIGVLRQEARS